MFKKSFLCLLTFIITLSIILAPVADAATKINCSSTSSQYRCQAIELYKGDTATYTSNSIYVPKGGEIYYQGISSGSGTQFSVTYWIIDANGNRVSSVRGVGPGSQTYYYYYPTTAGYYRIQAKCSDTTQGRCDAFVSLGYYY